MLALCFTTVPNFKDITHDPAVMGGKACIRGMRVTVGMVLGMLSAGHSHAEILELYPYLTAADIQNCLAYAAWRLQESKEPLAFA